MIPDLSGKITAFVNELLAVFEQDNDSLRPNAFLFKPVDKIIFAEYDYTLQLNTDECKWEIIMKK